MGAKASPRSWKCCSAIDRGAPGIDPLNVVNKLSAASSFSKGCSVANGLEYIRGKRDMYQSQKLVVSGVVFLSVFATMKLILRRGPLSDKKRAGHLARVSTARERMTGTELE